MKGKIVSARKTRDRKLRLVEQHKQWRVRLYVAGQTERCLAVLATLNTLCEKHIDGDYHIEIIDLLEKPELAKADRLEIPTLLRTFPEPMRRIIGDLSSSERVRIGFASKFNF